MHSFNSCGTTIDAVEKLGRDRIGINLTRLAISLIKNRLQDTYGRRMRFANGSARSSTGDSHLPLPQGEGMRVRVKGHREHATVPPHPGPLPPGEGESSAASTTAEAGIHLVRIIGEPTTPNKHGHQTELEM